MQNANAIELQSERLRQAPLSEKYTDDIFREFTTEITKYMFAQYTGNIKDTQNFVQRATEKITQGTDIFHVITDIKTGEFLGCCGLHRLQEEHPELGIWIKKSAHGKGIGKEAIGNLIEWARKNLQETTHLSYPVDEENIASRKIAESFGGTIVRTYKDNNIRGEVQNLVEYHIPLR